MGARLREKESLLDSLRALLSSLHTELAHRDAEYAKLHDPKARPAYTVKGEGGGDGSA
jgi:hypothetical protein